MKGGLRDFVAMLERRGELARIAVPVDPVLEIAEIADRMAKMAAGVQNGPVSVDRVDAGGGEWVGEGRTERTDARPRAIERARMAEARRRKAAGQHCELTDRSRLITRSVVPVCGGRQLCGLMAAARRTLSATCPCKELGPRPAEAQATTCGGKALLFERTGTRFPLLINMFGSERRMSMALGVDDLDTIPSDIEKLFAAIASPKPTLAAKGAALPALARLARLLPRRKRGRGACQQVVLRGDEARLSLLPILKCWPHDGGRFITLPLVHTIDPDTGATNVGMYRMQVFDDHTAGLHWHTHKTGERHYRAWRQRAEQAARSGEQSAPDGAGNPAVVVAAPYPPYGGGAASERPETKDGAGRGGRRREANRMPVSIALGGDPIYTYAATAPMPDGMDEYLLAGYFRGRGVRLVKCQTNDIYVPEDCDIVIEGYVDTSEPKRTEGPFGDHTGFYSLEDPYPVMHVTAITHRRDAIYPATVVGIPPMEDYYIGRATEKIFLAPIRLALQPEVRDLWMPAPGVAHNLALVEMECSYPGQAFKTAGALWGAGQMMFNKVMILSDKPVRDLATLAAGLRAARLPDDVFIGRGTLDILDHTTATPGAGGKLAIDLTARQSTRAMVSDTSPYLPSTAGCAERPASRGHEAAELPPSADRHHAVRDEPAPVGELAMLACGLPPSRLGHSSTLNGSRLGVGSLGSTLAGPFSAPAFPRHDVPRPNAADTSLADVWSIIILYAEPGAAVSVEDFIAENGITGVNFFVIVDTAARDLTHGELLWFALGNCEIGRDVTLTTIGPAPKSGATQTGEARGCILVADARTKLPGAAGRPARWPSVVVSSPETIALVDRRWDEYGLGAGEGEQPGDRPESPSLRYRRLLRSEKAEL